jgi:hypothetical protein
MITLLDVVDSFRVVNDLGSRGITVLGQKWNRDRLGVRTVEFFTGSHCVDNICRLITIPFAKLCTELEYICDLTEVLLTEATKIGWDSWFDARPDETEIHHLSQKDFSEGQTLLSSQPLLPFGNVTHT